MGIIIGPAKLIPAKFDREVIAFARDAKPSSPVHAPRHDQRSVSRPSLKLQKARLGRVGITHKSTSGIYFFRPGSCGLAFFRWP
jgi:hypothetical protein